MSELMNPRAARSNIRPNLLSTASFAVIMMSVLTASEVLAGDEERPTVWIELGGQLERVDGGQQAFAPPFVAQLDPDVFTSPATIQRPPRYAVGWNGKLSFQPEDSSWVFSAAVRYGRSNNTKGLHNETSPASAHFTYSVPILGSYGTGPVPALSRKSLDIASRNDESHLVLDFSAGKDVGLGMFGTGGMSLLSLGVRFAQFASRSSATINANPDFHFTYKYVTHLTFFPFPVKINQAQQAWHLYNATENTTRSFHGIGPSLAWDATVPIAGNEKSAEIAFDWGVNAAVIFGRQKVRSHHKTSAFYRSSAHNSINGPLTTVYQSPHHTTRTRAVVVPNIGGFAGLSLKFPNAKLSMGYRADFFFGAMDGGIDARRTEDVGFHGPYASVSIGLGG
jgi:hypothetical protein